MVKRVCPKIIKWANFRGIQQEIQCKRDKKDHLITFLYICVCSLEFISWLFVITGNNSAVAWQWPVLTPMIANILLLLPSLWIVTARFLSTKNVLFSKHLIFLFLGEYQEILLLHYLMISKSYSPSASIAAALFVYPKILVITQILLVLSKGTFFKKRDKVCIVVKFSKYSSGKRQNLFLNMVIL